MPVCPRCTHVTDDPDARYCSRCASPLERTAGEAAAAEEAPKKKKTRRILFVTIPLQILIAAGGYYYLKEGCSRVTGSIVSKGRPLGDFTFTPAQCRSGQRMQFFGAALLGKEHTDGAVIALIDPMKGKLIKVEIPGSCKPPDYEDCREEIIDPHFCSRYEVAVNKTGVVVNEITLLKGRVALDCSFPEGGSMKGEISFERCD